MEPLLPWKSVSITQPVCMCSLSYTARNAHDPHCRLWPGLLYKISSHYLIKGTIFEKKVIEHKICISILSTKFV
jgi:hypothetical protein